MRRIRASRGSAAVPPRRRARAARWRRGAHRGGGRGRARRHAPANGGNAQSASGQNAGGGSGGAIEIQCRTITGKAQLAAKSGGKANNGTDGGGGRIAVHYDRAAQAALGQTALSFTLAPYTWGGTCFHYESYRYFGECGTLYLTDDALFAGAPCNVFGQLHTGTGTLACDSIVLKGTWLAFTQDGFKVNVAHDVVLNASYAAPLPYGPRLEQRGALLYRFPCNSDQLVGGFRRAGGTEAVTFTVGGDFVVTGAYAEVVYRAAALQATNGYDRVPKGGLVEVGGTLSVTNNTRFYCVSHPTNGVSARSRTRNLAVRKRRITADGQGFFGRSRRRLLVRRHGVAGAVHLGLWSIGKVA